MFKFFSLAVAVSLLPVLKPVGNYDIINTPVTEPVFNFRFGTSNAINPFEPKKEKPAEAWSQNWMGEAQENIRKSEYNFTWEEKLKAYCTPNRKNNLRFFYDDKGFVVEPRTTQIPVKVNDPKLKPEELKYRSIANWEVNFCIDKNQFGKGLWKITDNKAEYLTEKITVQYINNDEGMRQNFIVFSPLSKDDGLTINFSIKTKLKTYLHGNQLQFFHKKTNVLNYEQLKVWDAAGKPLEASIKKHKKNKYFIKVDTKEAVYPITIDPISTTPSSTLDDANQANAFFGIAVASAGDVNGDGYSDVIIGANGYDDGANTNEGRAFVYHGSASGLSASPDSTPDDANQGSANFGQSVASAGDVNGDGYSDVIIGAPYFNDGVNADEGRAFVYHGSAAGLSATPNSTPDDANQAGAFMGYSVATAGDVNGDGYSDIIIGAPQYNASGSFEEGRAYIYQGSATGIQPTIARTLIGFNPQQYQDGEWFGNSVASAGDVNGDGYSDVIVGGFRYINNGIASAGLAFVYHGSATGISASANTMYAGSQANAFFGCSVACAGDVNGDGYSDVIIGAYGTATVGGAAFVYHGSATGLPASANKTLNVNQSNAQFGISVACAGDVNGDGYSDVIVGAILWDDGAASDIGGAFIYQGSATGLPTNATTKLIDLTQFNGSYYGNAVASAGDINGDGYSDVIIGAPNYDEGANANEGRAFVYHGSAEGLSASPTNTPDDANQADANFGASVASVGDVNADGYSDVIIGAPYFDDGVNTAEGKAFIYHGAATGLSTTPNSTPDDADQANSWFGNSVAGAGDVNGDGYSDVIIGAPRYDDAGNGDEGRAFVYYGTAAGLSASPGSTPDDANQINAFFGLSVSGAGDVNADGYSDVIVGAYQYDNGANVNEGRAFVYHGSASGLSALPNSTPDDANQAGALFGASVAGAGDVNGDGYGDVLIGASSYDDGANADEGRAFLYYGGIAGVVASPAAMPDDANQAGANFGTAVAGAGDVNADGYADIIIGASGFDDGANTNEGRAYVYYGSSTGLPATPNRTLDNANVAFAIFGNSVGNAGDVNGDGYSDVIVGALLYTEGANTNEGRAFVYHGSSTGLSASPASTPDDANQASSRLGSSVASAGDINGDGYSDVLIGASDYDEGASSNEGRAFLYNGNEFTTNERNNIRLYNTNVITPINNANFIVSNFGAGLFAKSFLGRNRGKLVWETRLNYNAYSGNPITNSVSFTGQQASYTNLGISGIELKNVISKINGASKYTKLRARVKYSPVLAITGQVYGPWRYVSSVIDGNNLGALPLDLISFNASWKQKGRSALLSFTTDKESGICCFDIEKSNDGFNYTTIATVAAKNTGGIQQYSYVDINATGKNQFYRLAIRGVNGKVENSNIQQLKNNSATEILVFPNPTTDVLQVQLNSSFNKINVQIVNSSGQTVIKQTFSSSNQTITIPVQNLAAGKYWLHLQSGAEKQVLQFVKL